MHILNTDISNGTNCSTLILRDASQWDPNIPVENGIIEVKSPLSDCFYSFSFDKDFNLILGCAALGICCQDCFPNEASLPDGNYQIKMSVDPNLKTMVEFNFFRECTLYTSYINTSCKLRDQKCDMLPKDYQIKLSKLRDIRLLMDEAKWMAEECLDVPQALIMYNEALDMLNKYNNKTC